MCEGDKSEREGEGHRDRESPEMSCSSHDADVSHGNETREKLNNKVTLTRSRNKQKRPLESDCELDNARASLRDCASSLPCTSHSDIESEKERTKGLSVTPGELKRIHCMIEQCIVRGYDKEETVAILFGVAGIDCRISGLCTYYKYTTLCLF